MRLKWAVGGCFDRSDYSSDGFHQAQCKITIANTTISRTIVKVRKKLTFLSKVLFSFLSFCSLENAKKMIKCVVKVISPDDLKDSPTRTALVGAVQTDKRYIMPDVLERLGLLLKDGI